MGHKALVGGTAYEISGGKCMVGGTAYAVTKGRTLVGGTGYDINFGPILISFSINGKTYAAEEGMTWDEFAESDYNDGSVSTRDGLVLYSAIHLVMTEDAGLITPDDVIISDHNYILPTAE